MTKRSASEFTMAVLQAVIEDHDTFTSIARAIDSPLRPIVDHVRELVDLGLLRMSPSRPAKFEITEKGHAILSMYRQAEAEVPRREAIRLQPTCGFCGRVLGLQYYFTCPVCGATYCYIHTWKHTGKHKEIRWEGKDKGIEVSAGRQKVVLMMSAPKTLERAFGVDGEPALQVAKMIVANRRAEVADR